MRLKNASVGYTIRDSKVLQRAGLSQVRVFASGNNLITWTKLVKGIDPESTSQNSNGYIFPLVRTYNLGMNISF
ncbi:hypothetical protein BN1088_1430656 [Sphingobacterium sp. PM2-P1-29]|nr:hypothetical protein BN1088_1430656 [Sphingobacterium sp. PM2-P1-29]